MAKGKTLKVVFKADNQRQAMLLQEDLDKQANINADKLLSVTSISFDTIGNRKLGLIEVEHTSLKAACFLRRV